MEPAKFYDEITQMFKKRAMIYPDSEIHGAVSGFYDFGSVGSKIKQNFERYWRQYFLRELKENIVEIEPTMINPEAVFVASGHTKNFVDPVAKCEKCKAIERADHILEAELKEDFEGKSIEEMGALIKKHNVKCPKCGGKLTDVGFLNMMFPIYIGAFDSKQTCYLRPETTQGPAVAFKREYTANREKLPLGIAVVGKVFRNEISARQGLFRLREFTQAEIQYFFDIDNKKHERFDEVKNYVINAVFADARDKGVQKVKCSEMVKKGYFEKYVYFMARVQQFYEKLGVPADKIRFFEKSKEERAFYNQYQFDCELYFNSYGGFKEISAVHYRTDYDLKNHKVDVQKDGKNIIPHIVELTFGIDRNIFGLLDLSFKKGKEGMYFSLPKQIAPYLAGVYSLVKKDGLEEKTNEVYDMLRTKFDVFVDHGGSIGRRYARSDEIGVPYGITIDHQTLEDNTVTVRDRDTTEQVRVKITDLEKVLSK